jgi:glycine dehydrogenase subunit 1
MLNTIGVKSIDELFTDIPKDKLVKELDLPPSRSEMEVIDILTGMSNKNRVFYDKPGFLGAGAYKHFTPSVVDAVLSRSEFYTAYTPYQAEASQGVLQSIFEYQTMIAMLTGLDVSNASLYDGATACAEAVTLAADHTRKKEILYSAGLHPEYVEVMKTYFKSSNVILKEIPLSDGTTNPDELNKHISAETAGVIIQNPNCLGFIEPAPEIGKVIKAANKKSLYIICINELHSTGVMKTPGECGADVAIGDAGSLGIPLSYGGPYVGFIASKTEVMRKLPGRLVGQTTDADGKRAFCLTLQAREQHIRREKASSNICSNSALSGLAITVYLSFLGKKGFADLAKLNLDKACYLKEKLSSIPGIKIAADKPFFNEFTIKCPDSPEKINKYLFDKGIVGGFPAGKWKDEWKDYMIICATEMNSKSQIDEFAIHLANYCRQEVNSACTIA